MLTRGHQGSAYSMAKESEEAPSAIPVRRKQMLQAGGDLSIHLPKRESYPRHGTLPMARESMRAYCRSCFWRKAHFGRRHVGAHWMRFQRPAGSTWTARPCNSLPTEQDLVVSALWLWKGSVGRKLALYYMYVAPGSLSSGRRHNVVLWRWWARCCWAARYRAVTGRVAVTGDNGESHSRWQG
jgi:hypothetical protein